MYGFNDKAIELYLHAEPIVCNERQKIFCFSDIDHFLIDSSIKFFLLDSLIF